MLPWWLVAIYGAIVGALGYRAGARGWNPARWFSARLRPRAPIGGVLVAQRDAETELFYRVKTNTDGTDESGAYALQRLTFAYFKACMDERPRAETDDMREAICVARGWRFER